jgi:hypothetical protein
MTVNASKLKSDRHLRAILAMSVAALVTSCDTLSPDTYWHSGDYELIAVDVKGQMTLSIDLHNTGAIGIVGPTVFALGADDRYIVVKQHPAKDGFGHFDRGVTNYFVVTRVAGSEADQEKAVQGPLSEVEFNRLRASDHLPPFTKTFTDLD